MGLTNQLPSSRLAQAGVIPNAAARPASPYAGQMLFQLDTKQLLIWDGTAWVMAVDTDTPPGLELVKTQTVGTAVSSVTVTDAFSANHANYKIMYINGTSSANANMTFQLSGITSNAYYAGVASANFSGGGYLGLGDNATTKWNYVGWGSIQLNILNMDIYNPFASTRTWYSATPSIVISGGTVGYGSAVGEVADTTSATGFVLAPGSGTMTGGTIRVYGYRN